MSADHRLVSTTTCHAQNNHYIPMLVIFPLMQLHAGLFVMAIASAAGAPEHLSRALSSASWSADANPVPAHVQKLGNNID